MKVLRKGQYSFTVNSEINAFIIVNPWPLAKALNLITTIAKILWRKITTKIMNATVYYCEPYSWYCHIFRINKNVTIISDFTVIIIGVIDYEPTDNIALFHTFHNEEIWL